MRVRPLLPLALLIAVAAAVVVVVRASGGGDGSPLPAAATRSAIPRGIRAPSRPAAPRVPQLSAAASRRQPVPILMYHVVNAPPPGAPFPALYVPAHEFASQMRALRDAGYHATTLARTWAAWHGRGTLPSHPVVVSFDDGYLSHVTHALPVLRKIGWAGVLNLELGKMGSPGALTDGQVRRLVRAGWEVDSHTITHPDLTTLDATRLRHELVDSRATIRRRFGVPADFFCYPAGRFNALVEAAVRAAGYRAATTTAPGLARPGGDAFALPRVRVNGGERASALVAQIAVLN